MKSRWLQSDLETSLAVTADIAGKVGGKMVHARDVERVEDPEVEAYYIRIYEGSPGFDLEKFPPYQYVHMTCWTFMEACATCDGSGGPLEDKCLSCHGKGCHPIERDPLL